MTYRICTFAHTPAPVYSFTLLARVLAPAEPHFAAITPHIVFFSLGLTAVAGSPSATSIVFLAGVKEVSPPRHQSLSLWILFTCVGCFGATDCAALSSIAELWRLPEADSPSDIIRNVHYCCVANAQIIVFALYCFQLGNKSDFATVMCDTVDFHSDSIPNKEKGGHANTDTFSSSFFNTALLLLMNCYHEPYFCMWYLSLHDHENVTVTTHGLLSCSGCFIGWVTALSLCPVYLTCENEEDIACIFCSSCFLHPHLGFSSLPHLSGRRLTQLSLISLVSHNSWLSVSLSVLWMRTLMWLDYPLLLVFLCTVGTFAPSPPARHRRKPGFNAVAAFFSGLA